jgi:hypothetical protein
VDWLHVAHRLEGMVTGAKMQSERNRLVRDGAMDEIEDIEMDSEANDMDFLRSQR